MKNLFSKISEMARSAAIAAGIGLGASQVLDSLSKISEKETKSLKKFGWIGASIAGGVALVTTTILCVKKRNEAKVYEKEREADAERHIKQCEAETEQYIKQRRADAELYTLQKQADERLIQAKAAAGCYRSVKANDSEPNNGNENGSESPEGNPNDTANPISDEEDLNTTINKTEVPEEEYINGILPKGGLVVEYGPTGNLKSAFCAQTGISLAEGKVPAFAPNGGTVNEPLDVVLFDAELNSLNIKKRYGKHGYVYPRNYTRKTNCRYAKVDDFLNEIERKALAKKHDTLFILDNLTAACKSLSKGVTQDFYDRLKNIQAAAKSKGVTLTFIVVCHVSKSYEEGKPIELTHLAGSANIFNFATNVIAIGPTKFGKDMKMIKVLKDRDNQPPEKVFLMKVEVDPYVHLTYHSSLMEKDVLPEKPKAKDKGDDVPLSKSGKPLSDSQLTTMQLNLAKGMGPDVVAKDVGCSRDTVQRWKRKWIEEGKLPPEA